MSPLLLHGERLVTTSQPFRLGVALTTIVRFSRGLRH